MMQTRAGDSGEPRRLNSCQDQACLVLWPSTAALMIQPRADTLGFRKGLLYFLVCVRCSDVGSGYHEAETTASQVLRVNIVPAPFTWRLRNGECRRCPGKIRYISYPPCRFFILSLHPPPRGREGMGGYGGILRFDVLTMPISANFFIEIGTMSLEHPHRRLPDFGPSEGLPIGLKNTATSSLSHYLQAKKPDDEDSRVPRS